MFILFRYIFSFFEVVISLIGVTIVLVGVFRAGLMLAPAYFTAIDSQTDDYRKARVLLAQYILLGLEFMVASDVIYTVFARDYEALIILVALVAVRTILAFSLERETREQK